MLLSNFSANSESDALRIADNLSLMTRVVESMHALRDHQAVIGASKVLLSVFRAIRKLQDRSAKHGILDRLLSLKGNNQWMPLMNVLVNNLKFDTTIQNSAMQTIHLYTLSILEPLFKFDADKYGLEFQQAGGIEKLEELQNSPIEDIH